MFMQQTLVGYPGLTDFFRVIRCGNLHPVCPKWKKGVSGWQLMICNVNELQYAMGSTSSKRQAVQSHAIRHTSHHSVVPQQITLVGPERMQSISNSANKHSVYRKSWNRWTPQPPYNSIARVQASFHVSYPNCVILRVKCIDYIGKGVLNSHLGANSDPWYIQNCVITNRVIKRFRCMWKLNMSWSYLKYK